MANSDDVIAAVGEPGSTDEVDAEGVLLADCQVLLNQLRERYEGRPDEQYRRLCRLALEREQLVSFAYRDDIIGQRLDAIDGPADVIALFRYALLQLWRDEEAHTVYVRGHLVQDRQSSRTVQALIEQGAGLLSGWSSALKHHVPRSAAPLRTLLVDGLALSARLVGRLSPELRAELGYKSFRGYCHYNVDAERTAELCWRRLIELDDELELGNRTQFERVAREEDEHRRVFALIADSLDDRDGLQPDWTAARVASELLAIAPRLVPPETRRSAAVDAGLGHGGEVHIVGPARGNKLEALHELLDRQLPDVSGQTVAIKASWMLGYSRDDPTSVVDAALIGALVDRLHLSGATTIGLLDGPNVYSDLYDGRDVKAVADHFGLSQPGARIEDTNADVVPLSTVATLGPELMSRTWRDADVRITTTRLRSHPTEQAHLTVANLEGVIHDSCRSVFWSRFYDYSAAAVAVGLEAPPHLAVIDAWDDCPDGWFGIMAGPHPKHPNRLYGGSDALAVDLVALRHTGSGDAIDSPTLRRCVEWFGDPRPTTTIVGTDDPIADWRNPYRNAATGLLADLSYPIYSWLSRGGAVFTPPMDEAFVERSALPWPLRPVRVAARRLLGLRPPRRSG